jgi:hypothetical protein
MGGMVRGADSDLEVGGIIMASEASLKIFLLAGGIIPPRNNKTSNAVV